MLATANPRSRRSRTVSKYFSICSPRPVTTQTVPLRPAGGAHRANRNSAPSGVLMVPATTSSGTGLAGIETSVMNGSGNVKSAENQGAGRQKTATSPPLEHQRAPPISPSCRPLPVFRGTGPLCFGSETQGCTVAKARPDGGRVRFNSRSMEDYPMRTYDLTPFYRSTVGFDRFFSLLDQATADGSPGYPPYNIERTGENAYRISVAVSGFAQGELSIVAKENTLTIKGEKSANENGNTSEVLYRGIAARAFERVFQLADFVVVKNASLEHGLLHVDLVREIPEAKKPRSIPISTSAPAPQVVDGSVEKAAA